MNAFFVQKRKSERLTSIVAMGTNSIEFDSFDLVFICTSLFKILHSLRRLGVDKPFFKTPKPLVIFEKG